MLSLVYILISDLVVTNLIMHSFASMSLLHLAMLTLHWSKMLKCCVRQNFMLCGKTHYLCRLCILRKAHDQRVCTEDW